MYREAGIVLAMIVMARLIILKMDQQIVILLKGRLFKHGLDMDIATTIYRKHKAVLSVILFVLGGAAVGISVILLANDDSLFWLSGAIAIALLGLGIWGRVASFRAADRELDHVGNASLHESAR